MNDEREREQKEASAPASAVGRRPYRSPVLTRYGTVEEIVDSGVVGSTMSITSK
jgi:hypothetical protein